MPFLVLFIALLSIVGTSAGNAWASDDEIRQQRALFVYDSFEHWLSAKYLFQDRSTDNGTPTRTSQRLNESYNATLRFEILNPHFFSASLGGSLGLTQNWFDSGDQSGSGNATRYTYQFAGSGLDRSPTPFIISSFQNSETVISPFSPSFTSKTSGTEFNLSLRNSFLPAVFRYSHQGLENIGGTVQSSSATDSFGFTADQEFRNFSKTAITLSLSQTSGSFQGNSGSTGRSYVAGVGNNLFWGPEAKHSLSTEFQITDSMSVKVPQRTTTYTETFTERLGKALSLQMSYLLSEVQTRTFEDVPIDTKASSGEILLTHRLFDSVTTRIKGRYNDNLLQGGEEIRYGGYADIAYQKKVPGDNRLTVNLMGGHEVVDNRVQIPEAQVLEQPHTGVHQGDIIQLVVSGRLSRVTSVRSNTPLFNYVEGTDYTVNLELAQITILVGGRIDQGGAGTNLFISYADATNSNMKYTTDTFRVASALTFLGGQYVVGASRFNSWMSRISGVGQNNLRNSSSSSVYLSANFEEANYRLSYSNMVTGDLVANSFEATGQYLKDAYWGKVNVVGTERCNVYGATATAPSYLENSLTVSLNAIKTLFSQVRGTLSLNGFDSRSDLRGPIDIVSLRVGATAPLNKFTATLDAQTSWNFTGGNRTREDVISLDLLRNF